MHTFPETGAIDLGNPDSFNYWTDDRIRFADTDQMGHVNNGAYANYLETGRVAILWSAMADIGLDHGWVIARLTLDYVEEVLFPRGADADPFIHIGTRVLKVGTKSVVFGQGLFVDNRVRAKAVSTIVAVDKNGSIAISDPVREALMRYAPEPAPAG
ncbi:MAG: acyl-CoA thioesterase [Alphaproteobacteria bacterium]|nr:acyl-CoA thioesterase [Alphaproteobacteria bacterium]